MFRITFICLFIFLTACSQNNPVTDRDQNASATYKVSFTSMWNSVDFPTNFPGSAHFSGLIGATHSDQLKLLEIGQPASSGIESMAETGSKFTLKSEIEAAKADGKAEFVLSGGGNSANGTTEFEFDINENYSLVSLVSMIAPSPDWFVGVRDMELYDNVATDWKDTESIDLIVYDSGTDSGVRFTSSDSDTQPKGIISSLTSAATDTDFVNGESSLTGKFIGTMVFTRIK